MSFSVLSISWPQSQGSSTRASTSFNDLRNKTVENLGYQLWPASAVNDFVLNVSDAELQSRASQAGISVEELRNRMEKVSGEFVRLVSEWASVNG